MALNENETPSSQSTTIIEEVQAVYRWGEKAETPHQLLWLRLQ